MRQQLKETRPQGTPLRPLKIYRMLNNTGPIYVPVHWQETVEIILVRKGTIKLNIREKAFLGEPGDVFYINPQELHGMQTPYAGCEYLAFLFPLGWLQSLYSDEADEKWITPLVHGNVQVESCLHEKASQYAAELLLDVLDLYDSTMPGAWLGIKAHIMQFYALIYRENLIGLRPGTSKHTDMLMSISRFIHENFSQPLTLDALGNKFHMSPKYFSSYFQKHFFRGFSEYLTAVRLENAKKILSETEFDIEFIAQKSVFSSSNYFIRTFRKYQGVTPGQYRKRLNS